MKHCMPKYSIVWTADNYPGAIIVTCIFFLALRAFATSFPAVLPLQKCHLASFLPVTFARGKPPRGLPSSIVKHDGFSCIFICGFVGIIVWYFATEMSILFLFSAPSKTL